MSNTLLSLFLITSSFDKIWNTYKGKATFVQLLRKFNMFNMGNISVDKIFVFSTLNEESLRNYGV